ncbi:glycyl-tRNA synthetase subunit beta [Klebsiella pneumoniae]|uniref:Glycine--tRNA ligase beta subunit n=1 Tax=Klebsiella pneumoniae TaxID=573 RepID=A0A377TGF4_KLEPN|nr:glycyl-tRNA synthetase subunit beta [Klebsiella pneumoniae]
MSENTFLVEIGTEELPPKALRSLAESFAANVTAELDNAGLAHGKVEWFAAPRRLALKVANLAAAQADREVEKRGPAIAPGVRCRRQAKQSGRRLGARLRYHRRSGRTSDHGQRRVVAVSRPCEG